ncbi:hypothetical protein C8F01DRAFT_126258 [Mycena amicta]|nr:hypothetical protein C8F01DRAFT_126258 [Mycena amicta]
MAPKSTKPTASKRMTEAQPTAYAAAVTPAYRRAPPRRVVDSDEENDYEREEQDPPQEQHLPIEYNGDEDVPDQEPEPAAQLQRPQRNRRPTEREVQRRADEVEEEELRQLQVAKAAQKQRRRDGELPAPVPLKDATFIHRDSHISKSRFLVQRSSRVPSPRPASPEHASPEQGAFSRSRTQPLASQSIRMEKVARPRPEWLDEIDEQAHALQNYPPNFQHVRPRPSPHVSHHGHMMLDLRTSPPTASGSSGSSYDVAERAERRRQDIQEQQRNELAAYEEHRPSPGSERSPSPVAGDKRQRSSDDTIDDLVHVAQAPKVNAQHRGLTRARDFDDSTQELISATCAIYRCLLTTKSGFPDSTQDLILVQDAWKMACSTLGVSMRLSTVLAKLIGKRGSQLRGELKTKTRALVELFFHFQSGQNTQTTRRNRQLAEDLKSDMGYAHYKFSPDASKRKGRYRARIIQKIVNVMWFNNRRDEGATHPELFGPMFPKPAFALVLTVIECCIDEWLSGVRTDVPFTAAEYASVYRGHLTSLEEFEKRTAPHPILEKILMRIHTDARFHSGAQPIAHAETASSLSQVAIV